MTHKSKLYIWVWLKDTVSADLNYYLCFSNVTLRLTPRRNKKRERVKGDNVALTSTSKAIDASCACVNCTQGRNMVTQRFSHFSTLSVHWFNIFWNV